MLRCGGEEGVEARSLFAPPLPLQSTWEPLPSGAGTRTRLPHPTRSWRAKVARLQRHGITPQAGTPGSRQPRPRSSAPAAVPALDAPNPGSRAAALPPPVGAGPGAATTCAAARQHGRPRLLSAESPAWLLGASTPNGTGRESPPGHCFRYRAANEEAVQEKCPGRHVRRRICAPGRRRAPEGPRPFGPALAQDDGYRLGRRSSSPQATAPGGRVGHGVGEGDGVAFVARAARWRSPWWRSRCGGRRIAGRSRRRSSRPPAGRSLAAFRPPQGGRRFHGLCRAHESRRRRCSGCDSRPNRGGTDLVIVPTKMRERSAARGPAPARPLHFRESGFSLASRSIRSGVPGRRGTPPWRSHGRTGGRCHAHARVCGGADRVAVGREAAGAPRRHS